MKRRTRGGEVGGPQVAVREMERKLRMEESGARSLPRKALSQRVRVAFDRPPMGGNGWHWSAGDWSGARPSMHVTEGPWSAGGWWRWRWQWAAAAGAIMISPCCTCSGRILGDCLEARNARVEKVGPFAARASESRPSHTSSPSKVKVDKPGHYRTGHIQNLSTPRGANSSPIR